MKHTFRGVTIVVAASVLAAGCADDGPPPVAAGPPAVPAATGEDGPPPVAPGPPAGPAATVDDVRAPVRTVTVQAIDNTFRPDRIEITPGTEVVWVNRGRNDHDLMTDFGFGVTATDFGPGEEYRHVFTEPGEYPYHCTIHGTPDIGMIGTVVVTDAT